MNQWTNEHSTSVSPLRLIMDITLPTFARHQAWWTCHQCWRLMCYEWVTVRFSRSKTLVLHGSHGCHLATSLLAIWLLFTSHHCFWFTSYIHFLYSLLIFKVSFLFVILWNPDGFPPSTIFDPGPGSLRHWGLNDSNVSLCDEGEMRRDLRRPQETSGDDDPDENRGRILIPSFWRQMEFSIVQMYSNV